MANLLPIIIIGVLAIGLTVIRIYQIIEGTIVFVIGREPEPEPETELESETDLESVSSFD